MNRTQKRLPRRWLIGLLFAVLAGLVVSVAAERPIFTKNQKAFYLTEQELAFIRPGLVVEIVDASIDEDGTIRARLKITDPRGLPLDRDGIFTPGPVSTSLVASVLPAAEELYTAYTTRMQTSPITGVTAIQASSDSGGAYEKVADGEYNTRSRPRPRQILTAAPRIRSESTLGVISRNSTSASLRTMTRLTLCLTARK